MQKDCQKPQKSLAMDHARTSTNIAHTATGWRRCRLRALGHVRWPSIRTIHEVRTVTIRVERFVWVYRVLYKNWIQVVSIMATFAAIAAWTSRISSWTSWQFDVAESKTYRSVSVCHLPNETDTISASCFAYSNQSLTRQHVIVFPFELHSLQAGVS
jgi:hypothetical protein